MDAARWQRVKALLDAALDRPPEARGPFLDGACAGDAALRAEVAALLGAHDAAGGAFLEALPRALGRRPTPPPEEPPEAHAGPYRLVEKVGEGGMGTVYRAERADGAFHKAVALKLVKRGMDTDEILARFRRERHALARLDHPNIARLLDGGATADGRPWFAMEYVEGEPVTAYAERRGLGVAARLRLFLAVCEAVHHAHARLVVHRDLKPSNVLVTEGETGQPQVKLLDFGIARLLAGDAEPERSALTETGLRPMTRAYAAPEQVRGEAATTAADVYGLGVLLYELLTGSRPFEGYPPTALEAAILTQAPSRPSAVAAPGRARRLRGDLDTVVLKALAKDPAWRYPSAEALAEDVRRHLDGLPVTARPPAVGYRVRKFVDRHRVGVAAAAAVAVAFAAFGAFHLSRLSAERDQARRAAAEAEGVSALLVGLFDRDPLAADAARLDTLSVRAFLLDRGAEAVEGVEGQPALQARLLALLGRLHGRLGSYDDARALAARAVALYDALGLGATAEAAEAHTALATALEHRGDAAEAEAHYRRALEIRRALLGDDHAATAEATNNLAVLLMDHPREDAWEEAIVLAHAALDTYRDLLGDDHLDVAQAHNNVGSAYFQRGDLEAAAPHYRRALEVRRRQLGRHPLVANTLSNLANLVHDQGQAQEAVTLFQEALGIWRATLPPEHPLVSTGLYGLGEALVDLGRLAEAEAAFAESHAIDRATLPPDHPYIAEGLANLGAVRLRRGRLSEAEATLRAALDAYARRPEAEAADRAAAEAALGACLLRLGRAAEAVPLLQGALPHLDAERAEAARVDLGRALPSAAAPGARQR